MAKNKLKFLRKNVEQKMLENNFKKINTAVVLVIGIFLVCFVTLKILYPKNYFSSSKSNMTVSVSKFTENQKNSNEKNEQFISVAPQIEHNFYSIKAQSNRDLKGNKNSSVSKGFLVQLYPIGNEIVSEEELKGFIFSNGTTPNGELISTKDAVYIYSRGKWRPFLGAQIFENLKLDWKRVQKLSEQQESSFEEGERIIFRSAHPEGTILQNKKNELFLVWNKELLPIKNKEILKNVWPDYFTVKIDKIKPQKIADCKEGSVIYCKFPNDIRTKDIAGNVFILNLEKEIKEGQTFDVTLDSFNLNDTDNIKLTLSVNKNRLLEKYSDEIFR